ncbi:hypothetical protein ACJX0J_024168, partial [Zea mays]
HGGGRGRRSCLLSLVGLIFPRLLVPRGIVAKLYVQKSNFAVRRLSCYPSLGRHQTSEVATEYLFPEPRSGGKKAKATADQAPKIRVSSGHLWREWQVHRRALHTHLG